MEKLQDNWLSSAQTVQDPADTTQEKGFFLNLSFPIDPHNAAMDISFVELPYLWWRVFLKKLTVLPTNLIKSTSLLLFISDALSLYLKKMEWLNTQVRWLQPTWSSLKTHLCDNSSAADVMFALAEHMYVLANVIWSLDGHSCRLSIRSLEFESHWHHKLFCFHPLLRLTVVRFSYWLPQWARTNMD